VRVADVADHLGANHAVAGVAFFPYMAWIDGIEVAGPATARVELGVRGEQRGVTAYAAVDAGGEGVPVATGEGGFGALAANDGVFVGTELGAPLGVGFDDFLHG